MPQRRFPRLWCFEPIPGGHRVVDANGLALAREVLVGKRLPNQCACPFVVFIRVVAPAIESTRKMMPAEFDVQER
jgi:hypothetical protein